MRHLVANKKAIYQNKYYPGVCLTYFYYEQITH